MIQYMPELNLHLSLYMAKETEKAMGNAKDRAPLFRWTSNEVAKGLIAITQKLGWG